MNWLIQYIRSWFCKHEIEITASEIYRNLPGTYKWVLELRKTFYCKKCGWIKQRWG